jgi:hypothetical protein
VECEELLKLLEILEVVVKIRGEHESLSSSYSTEEIFGIGHTTDI